MKSNFTTVFYENSYGIMCRWKAEVLFQTETTIDLLFPNSQAFHYNLKLNSGFLLVTKNPVKSTVPIDGQVSFDDDLRARLIEQHKENTALLWDGTRFTISHKTA